MDHRELHAMSLHFPKLTATATYRTNTFGIIECYMAVLEHFLESRL